MESNRKIPGEALPKVSPETQAKIFDAIKEDSTLPIHIQSQGIPKKPSEFRKILLTGVTGHLGPYLLQQLSQQESLTHIYCIVRATTINNAKERVITKLREANILEKTNVSKIIYVLGDIAKKNLGLEKTTYAYLANNIDAVVNNAVKANHIKKYPLWTGSDDHANCELRGVNVTGVKNILEFACTGVTKPVLHGSTFACTNRIDPVDGRLREEFPEKDNLGDGINWGYGYSKFVGEKLAKTAVEERGIPVTVIRYPCICGDSTTGYTAVLDNVTTLVLSFWSSGLYFQNNFGLCTIPVDVCAHLAVKLFLNDNASTGLYNLSPPSSITVNDMYDVAEKNGFSRIRKCSYEEYFETILNLEDKSNQFLMIYKKIYSEGHGVKEFFHSTPALRLVWYDPPKVAGISRKMDKFIPGYGKLIPNPHQCLQNMLDFFSNSKRFPNLGLNFKGKNGGGIKQTPRAAFLALFCFIKSDVILDKKQNNLKKV